MCTPATTVLILLETKTSSYVKLHQNYTVKIASHTSKLSPTAMDSGSSDDLFIMAMPLLACFEDVRLTAKCCNFCSAPFKGTIRKLEKTDEIT